MNINPVFYALTLCLALSACPSSETKTDSTHQTHFVHVADSTKLGVLDWDGTGKPILFPIKKEVAHGTLKVIAGANHYVFISHPDEEKTEAKRYNTLFDDYI